VVILVNMHAILYSKLSVHSLISEWFFLGIHCENKPDESA